MSSEIKVGLLNYASNQRVQEMRTFLDRSESVLRLRKREYLHCSSCKRVSVVRKMSGLQVVFLPCLHKRFALVIDIHLVRPRLIFTNGSQQKSYDCAL